MNNCQRDLILIVDDIPNNLKVLFDILNKSGFKVSIAKSGEGALEKAQEILPNLILLDVMMPGIDGFETCRRLKTNQKTKDIPVIFMTALSETVEKVKGLHVGAVDYITKPIEHEEVLARINVHLDLRKMQLKLVQKEKMSSLGQLVAGIAHEINNPVNFIYGNLIYAQNYIENLLKLLNLYEVYTPVSIQEIQEFSNVIELDFIKKDLPKLLASMMVGSDRIQEIVRSLRIFSRLDEAEIKKVDLHVGIDSTLMILHSRLRATQERRAIEVIKEYGDLVPIECYAGQLNQVFMNILSNAIDAIDEKINNQQVVNFEKSEVDKLIILPSLSTQLSTSDSIFLKRKIEFTPQIQIRTELTEDKKLILIKITDNGIGISQEIQQRIFEQFFTTKDVGKGTGLGLAIAHQIIVEKHRGTLEVKSVLGHGSQFTIAIPIY
ncbi:sensor histidine kinase [aff. Roholtiella sp. LEGE 12411]|uniref:sensor histidine kinase n=1 Tax=aff. Roholtiella sp. LEGE 12411 TaxID=1828822 RepID=UPI00187F1865|nr:response regulator [aff. Roholtiella sp. LEGE 12411]MBE9037929.1 hybrid sensor histidine kinase/response regulator [aff. Roholtiella sp. LEGE 12411]